MKSNSFTGVLILFFLSNTVLYAKSPYEISVDAAADGYCVSKKDANLKCLNMGESQCKIFLVGIIQKCSLFYGDYPIPAEDTIATEQFNVCIGNEFESFVVSKGLTLDTPCGQ